MPSMNETCSVCGASFEVQFRYQMEERNGGFSFYCSQKCLESNQTGGDGGLVVCDGCAKRFRVELVSQVLYVEGRRRYACSAQCRSQLVQEARGVRLGELVQSAEPLAVSEPPPPPESVAPPAQAPSAPPPSMGPAQAVPLIPPLQKAGVKPAVARPSAAAPTNDAPRLIAVFNHKGGTGKTTTSISIAAGLASAGKKVLLVDTDAQGNVAVSLNLKAEKSLYHVLVMGLPLKTVTQKVRENLELVASNETLAAAELYLAGRQNRDRVLSDRLSLATQSYDYVILDCSPSLSLMNQNALVFADSVLVPVACDYLSLVGVRQVVKTVRNVNQLLHHPVRIWGVLPTMYDARANICREAVETLRQHFGYRCLPPIRSSIKVKEAPAHGQTIFEYPGASNSVEDYRRVVQFILHGYPAEVVDQPSEAASA